MVIELAGRRYEVLLGSDVESDGMYLELNDVTRGAPESVLVVFRSDVDGRMTLSARAVDLPLDAAEWFIAEAKRRLEARAG